ncbi:hypothetical protein QBC43DRAFT_335240 [Cladorrhinum sp. PSN259]|nr:hypothetical protein QBC43DRAFT_335240 [Cladorrhinum sp. PSN259]
MATHYPNYQNQHRDPNASPNLGDSINIATRTAHTKLNKNLLVRLPLCLPPRACNPTVYLSGILHIAPIYLAFESAWDEILGDHELNASSSSGRGDCGPEPCHPDSSSLSDSRTLPLFPFGPVADFDGVRHKGKACERIHGVLGRLRLEGLARTERLLGDIGAMSGWSEEEVKENVTRASEAGRLKEFVAHIKRSVDKSPEVLLAYAWVLYMALFSGGRFIRSSLEGAGLEFWGKKSDGVLPLGIKCNQPSLDLASGTSGLPLSFFRFATPRDGEDLKIEFKKRFLECGESLLTKSERERVVREAICIFDNMNLLVGQLDGVFGGMNRSPSGSMDSWAGLLVPNSSSSSGVPKSFLGIGAGRLRDSVAVAKERLGMMGWNKDNKHQAHGNSKETPEEKEGEAREGDTTTLHAKGTLTSSFEQEGSEDEGEEAERKTGVKVVRFGSENAVLLKKYGRPTGKSVTVEPEGETTPPEIGSLDLMEKKPLASIWDDKISLSTVESAVWSFILVAVVAGLVWGYGQV